MTHKLVGTDPSSFIGPGASVIIDKNGTAVSLSELATGIDNGKYSEDLIPNIVFIRGDEWVLFSCPELEAEAYKMWKDEWVGFVREPEVMVRDIAEYVAF